MRAISLAFRHIFASAITLGLAQAVPGQERVVTTVGSHVQTQASQFGGFESQGSCSGGTPTIQCAGGACYGTSGADVIEGTDGDDEIHAHGGDDIVCGRRGHDTIYGNAGNDDLSGDQGGDTIYGGDGRNLLNGNGGNDTLVGDDGDDRIYGGDDVDVIEGHGGADFIAGGESGDTIHAGRGADLVYGEGGADSIYGQGGVDVILGGPDGDTIEGGGDGDTIYGEDGANTLRGGDGADVIGGGPHGDVIYGDDGADDLDGNSGDDTLRGNGGADRLEGSDGNDLCDGGEGVDEEIGSTCEQVERIEIPEPEDAPGDGGESPEPGDVAGEGAPCEVWDQDCPDGQKCVADSVGGEPHCHHIADNPGQLGDSCDSLGDDDGDDCDIGLMCVNGTCAAHCGGTPASPTCGAGEACHFYDDGPALCEQECNPLANGECPTGTVCAAENGALEVFTCAPAMDPPLGDAGEPCTEMAQCQPGHACMSSGVLEFGFCDDGATDCCAPLCELGEAGVCTGDASCIPFYSDPPPGLEDVGVCALGF